METNEKPTRLGTISFVLAVAVIVLWCAYFVVFAATTEGGLTFGMDSESAGYAVVLGGGVIMAALTILITLAGVITGLLALRNKDPKRGLAIAGLVINFLCFAPYCLGLILVAAGGLSAADFPSFGP